MIRIPIREQVLLSTLGFDSILNRLDSAISSPEDYSREPKPYIGEIQGFKFWANRLIGSEYLHFPNWLLPKIEGRIYELELGYQISLVAKLHRSTSILLLIGLGGVTAYTLSCLLGNVLNGVTDFKYFQDLGIIACIYLVITLYFSLTARRAMNFFKVLFAQRLLGSSQLYLDNRPPQLSVIGGQMSTFSARLRNNLPQLKPSADLNFPSISTKIPHRERSS
jgi:hypothetical protein